MQIRSTIAVVILLCCFDRYDETRNARNARGRFNNNQCEWLEEHRSGSERAFKIKCCNPNIACNYTGDPHKCRKLYLVKKKVYEFYDCLAKDSLKNAENACSKQVLHCDLCDKKKKYPMEEADFYKEIRNTPHRRPRSSESHLAVSARSSGLTCAAKDSDEFGLASKIKEFFQRPIVIAVIVGVLLVLVLVGCVVSRCR